VSKGARAAGNRDVDAARGEGARVGRQTRAAGDTLVAVVEKRGRFWAAEPYFPAVQTTPDRRRQGTRARRRIVLASNRVHGPGGGTVGQGELVLVRLGGRGTGGKANVLRALGRPDVARDGIEALMLDRGLAREFAPGVLSAAEHARDEGLKRARREVEQGRRRDLRELATLTIDPASARDFDDAISAQRLDGEGTVRVWVHIADVSAYVPEGSPVDREAHRRATSVYVPGAVEPMLPEALSADACSLMPGAERAAVTVELDLDLDSARAVRSAFYRSLIRSDERLDYDRVDRVFAGRERAQDPWAAPLAAAREASAALGRARERAGGLVLDSEEPEVVFDEEGNVSEIRASAQTESHRLIEHLMIAANEAVAARLAERKVGCLYRVHERPEPARVARLVEQLASLGVPTPAVPDPMSPSQAAELMGEISQRVERYVRSALRRSALRRDALRRGAEARIGPWGGRIGLTSLVLRSLKQAYYSPKNIGHAGLHSPCYCHFTSPIRRYPDLVCHRALIATLDGASATPQERELGGLGEWSSERERDAMRIEREADDVARCYALEQRLYEDGWEQTFTGEVTGLISAGAFVAFGGMGDLAGAEPGSRSESGTQTGMGPGAESSGPCGPLYEGMLPVRRMRAAQAERDWWELNEHETILRGERSGRAIRLGDEIEVRVARVDTVRGRVDLIPAG
jgi:ribonuclease R